MGQNICSLYQLSFPNGKLYLGVSNDPLRRLVEHIRGSSGSLVSKAIAKYGVPQMAVLLVSTREYCLEIEQKLTKVWNTVAPYGYNLQHGGTGGSVPSTASRQKMRESHVGYTHSKETLAKMCASHKNRSPINEDTRRRMRRSAANRIMPPVSAETKRLLSEATKHVWAERKLAAQGGV